MGIDFIGDVHGHAAVLERLLALLGYRLREGCWRHPTRKAFFLGDLIDRGPEIPRTLSLVRAMVEAGAARCLLGNHEYNALAWATPDGQGGFLRPHGPARLAQHRATLEAYGGGVALPAGEPGAVSRLALANPAWREQLAWLSTLPPWVEGEGFRAIHAAWIPGQLRVLGALLGRERFVDERFLHETSRVGSLAFLALEACLKGPEADLPQRQALPDHEGQLRQRARLRWWIPRETEVSTARLFHLEGAVCPGLEGLPFPALERPSLAEPPVFFGHYWMRGKPHLLGPRAACLDWSVALGGSLCAYRWDGEQDLAAEKLAWVPA